MGPAYVHSIRVRYAECDRQDVVFNPHYLAYFDMSMTELFRVALGGYEELTTRGADIVLADTAGRRSNSTNLLDELSKIRRVADREPGQVVETFMVLDATTGQNGLRQARLFAEAVAVDGLVLTKLDGTAKGGIALAIAHELGIPVKLIGVGEKLEDLRPFDATEFARALVT